MPCVADSNYFQVNYKCIFKAPAIFICGRLLNMYKSFM